ncbi:ATP-dependent DNA helicase RecG [Parafrankia irregularis]|uniref:Probable DNA 3'-5' helicase RecG n=1 Tax=Parafrankia irregularis TaxID=795642 RepID=A0A0S4QKS5_9ACTN|nr:MULTISPECIES: ATP-dependent DNA helicase RecG [Parafrankia]MBE3205406.1 ATP-dependent DNA helicase RecG [Parafrankia sp. CH37]CUU55698.1 ATP-dependent DNA helicase RecG [Parafrankia irregularis]
MLDLDTPLKSVLGAKHASLLADELDLATVGDLLNHLPRRYHERGELTDLDGLVVGEIATVQARVTKVVKHKPRADWNTSNRRRESGRTEITVTDGRGELSLVFFNQQWRAKALTPGTTALFAGKVAEFRGRRQLIHPEVHMIDGPDSDDDAGDGQLGAAGGQLGELGVGVGGDDVAGELGEQASAVADFAGALVPIYPATAKLTSWKIARCLRLVLDSLRGLTDPLPESVRSRHRLVGLARAYQLIHRPGTRGDVAVARTRLKWDEALVVQIALAQRRRRVELVATQPRPGRAGGLLDAFDASLPFALTDGQREVSETIAAELAKAVPMHRLLQGEVGSGKTVVAVRAMLLAVDSGGQAVLLAPTETLAAQHHRSLLRLLGDQARAGELGVSGPATRVALLTGSMPARARRDTLAAIADGSVGLVVGTHALLGAGVTFHDLALVVVDEQHRFGVEQRDELRSRGRRPPHLLVMTATPIPRTVAMTVFGDLEVSVLNQLPSGRSPISTFVVPAVNTVLMGRMWGRVREEVAAGHQAYVVCPRVGEGPAGAGDPAGTEEPAPPEPGEPGQAGGQGPRDGGERVGATVAQTLPRLVAGELAGVRVEGLHGRMPAAARDDVMTRFAAGEVDVLVATTVIEVGVDVPNATVMIILDSDWFGVSQLHQLRGRVGRGSAPGICLLQTCVDATAPAAERLRAVASTSDGAELALLDLAQRREGDVLGAAQSGGRRSLRLLELLRDEDLIRSAREEAGAIVAADPELQSLPALHRLLADALDETSAAFLEKG